MDVRLSFLDCRFFGATAEGDLGGRQWCVASPTLLFNMMFCMVLKPACVNACCIFSCVVPLVQL